MRAYIKNLMKCKTLDIPHSYYSVLGVTETMFNYRASITNFKYCFDNGCSFISKGTTIGREQNKTSPEDAIYGNIVWGSCMETKNCK